MRRFHLRCMRFIKRYEIGVVPRQFRSIKAELLSLGSAVVLRYLAKVCR